MKLEKQIAGHWVPVELPSYWPVMDEVDQALQEAAAELHERASRYDIETPMYRVIAQIPVL